MRKKTAADRVSITLITYDATGATERQINSNEIEGIDTQNSTCWLNIDGVQDAKVLDVIAKKFGLHGLVVEDISNIRQRPKMEDHGHYIYLVVRMLSLAEASEDVTSEQISIVFGRNHVKIGRAHV